MMTRFLIFILIMSCSTTRPTPYQKEKKKEGYRDSGLEDLKVASFKGNYKTKKPTAQRYAEFRAIENCAVKESKHANIIDIFDKTVEKEITRNSGSSWGPSYLGMYPYYSRYSSIGINAGFNTISYDSWNEKLIYPIIEVYYTCADKIYRPQLILKELSAEDMKHLVKDVKGGIQVEKILDSSPNRSSLKEGDIVLKASGKRIESVFELIRLFNTENRDISVQLLREGERLVAIIQSVDITPEVDKTEKNIILKVCQDKKGKNQRELKNKKICH